MPVSELDMFQLFIIFRCEKFLKDAVAPMLE